MSNAYTINNVSLYDSTLSACSHSSLSLQNGRITAIESACPKAHGETDSVALTLIKPFCDYHYHLPGSMLFDMFGINLCAHDVKDYRGLLSRVPKGTEVVRGFGWDVDALSDYFSQTADSPLDFLDSLFPFRAVVLFSLDFHCCWCNSVALSILREEGITPTFTGGEIPDNSSCILYEDIAEKIFACRRLCFSDEELEQALLAEQARLLSLGICEVFSLMFIGASHDAVLNALARLRRDGRLLLKVRYSYTVHPGEDTGAIRRRIEQELARSSEQLSFFGLKMYADGVIDNHSALLSEPYADRSFCGNPIWEEQDFKRVALCAAEYGLPVHVHAIGDAAVSFAARILSEIPSPSRGRHIIAHIQLSSPEATKKMSEAKIFAAMQPFWFYRGEDALTVDSVRLGSRIHQMYPVRDLLLSGVQILFSSDCPATPEGDPLLGMHIATISKGKERMTRAEAYEAYRMGAYDGEDAALSVGDEATFLLFEGNPLIEKHARLRSVYVRGKRVF